jgi:cytoskeletal protein RodZ
MIGDKLRQERERQNLSIKDIEKGTSIRALYIDAIEKGDYKTLPGEVYTKGFIRNIANYLHLDANACVKQFNEEAHPENKHSDVPGTKAAKPMPIIKYEARQGNVFIEKDRRKETGEECTWSFPCKLPAGF